MGVYVSAPGSVHDSFFIRSMSNLRVAKELLQQHLPEDILQAFKLEALEICKDKFHQVNLQSKITDMLFKAPLKLDPASIAYIAVLVEHQSTPQKEMPLRILAYEAAIMQQHYSNYGVVPLIYSIVFYNGLIPWNYSRDLKELIQAPKELVARYALEPFKLIELNKISDTQLRQYQWSGVMSLVMKHIYDRDILPTFRKMLDLLEFMKMHQGGDFVWSLLYYIYNKAQISDEKEFFRLIDSALSLEGERTMATLAEIHLERGRQQGRQQGRQEQGLAIARNLLGKGLEPLLVAETTGIDMQLIEDLMVDIER